VTIANERPYLWLIYVLVLVMPFVLCAACCIRSKVRICTGFVGIVCLCCVYSGTSKIREIPMYLFVSNSLHSTKVLRPQVVY